MTNNWIGYFLALLLIGLLIWVGSKQVQEYYDQSDPMLKILKDILLPLDPVVKKINFYKGNKSYTINKEKVYLCLYDENNQYYPLNMLLYVTIHELAHVLNKVDVGHTESFHKKFDELLDRAIELNIYDPSIPIVKNYCNHGEDE